MTTTQLSRIENRRIPQGYKPMFEGKLASCYISADGLTAKFYKGTAQKPVFWTKFRSEENLKKHVNDMLNRILNWEEMKLARKTARKNALSNVKVGDMFHYSWGYEQTNCEFYQVLECNGKSMKIKRIACRDVGSEGSSMSTQLKPIKDGFLEGEETLVKTSLSMPFGLLNPVDLDRSYYSSWYA